MYIITHELRRVHSGTKLNWYVEGGGMTFMYITVLDMPKVFFICQDPFYTGLFRINDFGDPLKLYV